MHKDDGLFAFREGSERRVHMDMCRRRLEIGQPVIGSRRFVDEMFAGAKDRFGSARRTGARKLRGNASEAADVLWSLRDLRKGI